MIDLDDLEKRVKAVEFKDALITLRSGIVEELVSEIRRHRGINQDDHESIKNLKAWIHWKRKEKDVSHDDLEFAKAIEDTITQANNWKAKYEDSEKTLECLDVRYERYRKALQEIKDRDFRGNRCSCMTVAYEALNPEDP